MLGWLSSRIRSGHSFRMSPVPFAMEQTCTHGSLTCEQAKSNLLMTRRRPRTWSFGGEYSVVKMTALPTKAELQLFHCRLQSMEGEARNDDRTASVFASHISKRCGCDHCRDDCMRRRGVF